MGKPLRSDFGEFHMVWIFHDIVRNLNFVVYAPQAISCRAVTLEPARAMALTIARAPQPASDGAGQTFSKQQILNFCDRLGRSLNGNDSAISC